MLIIITNYTVVTPTYYYQSTYIMTPQEAGSTPSSLAVNILLIDLASRLFLVHLDQVTHLAQPVKFGEIHDYTVMRSLKDFVATQVSESSILF